MQAWWILTRRELAGFFCSLAGYVIIAAAAFLTGLSFVILLMKLQDEPTSMPVTELFYVTAFFWLILLLAVPVITMRLFALEKFTGTFETLMTTPVSDLQVVAAKFSAAMVFYLLMWLPLLCCILILRHYTGEVSGFDGGALGCTYLGIMLLGGVFVSLGCLASALTRSQTTAAMISVGFNVSLFLVSFLAVKLPDGDWKTQVLGRLGLPDQMHDFVRGVADTRTVVLYLTLTLFFLFFTLRVVESRRWK
jgi:ABC-2 type transport system permease protein